MDGLIDSYVSEDEEEDMGGMKEGSGEQGDKPDDSEEDVEDMEHEGCCHYFLLLTNLSL